MVFNLLIGRGLILGLVPAQYLAVEVSAEVHAVMRETKMRRWTMATGLAQKITIKPSLFFKIPPFCDTPFPPADPTDFEYKNRNVSLSTYLFV